MLTKKVYYSLSALFLASASLAQASLYDSLTPDQKSALEQEGGQVTVTTDIAGSAWPSVTVYQIVKATPDQAAAVMFDYPLHTQMFEGLTKAEPKSPGAAVTDIDYTMKLPAVMGVSLPDEHYTVNDILSPLGAAGYQITWTLVSASSMQDCSGSSKFEPRGNGTLIAYTNFINPPSKYGSLAKLIKGMAIKRVKDTVAALAKQVSSEISRDQDKLNGQLAALHKALGK